MVYVMVETLGCAWDEAEADKKAISLAAETAVMLDRLMVAPLAPILADLTVAKLVFLTGILKDESRAVR